MGIRTRRARRHSRTHIVGFGVAGIFGFIALLIGALVISLGGLVSSWLQDLPDYQSADAWLVSEPTTVLDANGNTIAEYYLQNRRSVDEDQVSDYVLKGIVDTEDVRFYKHNGVDPQGIVRAVFVQLSGGSEGASTITQQLVRNTVLSDEQFEQTLKRKVREAYLAIQMEKMYTKDQILMMYLNTIYFGHSAYGIEAASITYFNKDAKDLTLAEAATLCGLPQSPSAYDPLVNPEAAKTRRNIVLDRMLSAGDITQKEHDEAQAEDMVTNEGSFADPQGPYPYFTDYVREQLLQDFSQDTVYQGGLKVYTTLDPNMQDAANKAVSDTLGDINNDKLDAAMVAVDPSNGYIKAMVGGKDYSASQYNLATQARRQTGSSFKLYTLVTALSQGMNPSIRINCNSPMRFSPTWRVQNFGNINYGTLSLKDAFAVSSNTGFVQVIQAVGASNVANTAHSMGIDVDMPAYDSLTLGTVGVPPIQMAEGYATVAAGGVHRDAIAITKIEDRNGNTVYEHTDEPTQVIDPAVNKDVIDVMEGVMSGRGTAASARPAISIDQPVGGKTGTSENYRDLWFCGITPQLSVAVWCGYSGDEEASVRVGGSNGHPYNTACPIFNRFVNTALAGVSRAEFPTTDQQATYKSSDEWKFSGGNYGESSRDDSGDDDYDSSSSRRSYSGDESSNDSESGTGRRSSQQGDSPAGGNGTAGGAGGTGTGNGTGSNGAGTSGNAASGANGGDASGTGGGGPTDNGQ